MNYLHHIDRQSEVIAYLQQLDIACDQKQIDVLCRELNKRSARTTGCLSVGGCSVKDWIRLWFSEKEPTGCQVANVDHVSCRFHFWPWDEYKYGPRPKESAGTNIDTMRSPTYRLRDAKPIDRTAWKVAKNGFRARNHASEA